MVGVRLVFSTAVVRSGDANFKCSGLATPIRSNPRITSALPMLMRFGAAIGLRLISRCDITAPPFCAEPVWSSVATYNPSIQAAVASSALIVTTPVPPIPGSRRCDSRRRSAQFRGARELRVEGSARQRLLRRPVPGLIFTVTNEGQSPSAHE